MRVRRSLRRPRVSVVIASFQWPEALGLSLASSLEQTVEDVEVLVIEDGPDLASRAVVREARDRRVRWLALREGSGSQSGPNALGRRHARAPIVAYLGHDDLWHPEHLETLCAVLTPDVDLAHAVTLYLGAGDDERMEIAGSDPWGPEAFVPPSSVAHWRDSSRIGPWELPDHTGMPVDHAFLMGSHARGVRVMTSGQPTVFKYPATWRLDCYRTRDVTPQRELRERLSGAPMLGHELVRAARARGVPGSLPAPPLQPPGVIADYNRRLKGLTARFAAPMTRWRPGGPLLFPGWHAAERDALGGFAWTGPQERAFVRLDAPGDGELGVRVVVRHAVLSEQLERLAVDVDAVPVALSRSRDENGVVVLTGWLGRPARQPTVEVGLMTTPVHARSHDPSSADVRVLGVAVSEVELLTRAVAQPRAARTA